MPRRLSTSDENGASSGFPNDAPEESFQTESGGADRNRTDDLLSAIQALSQLSYSPNFTKYTRGF